MFQHCQCQVPLVQDSYTKCEEGRNHLPAKAVGENVELLNAGA